MVKTFTILPGVELRHFADSRFKQGYFTVQFLRPMCMAEASLNALLPSVLLQGTRLHPDLQSITRLLDDLYGADVNPMVRRVGDCQGTGLSCGFLEDRYALPGDQVFAPMTRFVEELLTQPLFSPEIVEREKENLISLIESEKNDKAAYAMNRMLRLMCGDDSFGIPRLGTAEAVADITPQSLQAHFDAVLRESPVQVFYVGSMPPEAVIAAVREIFSVIARNPGVAPAQIPFAGGQPRNVTETMEVAQGKLCMGFTTPVTSRHPAFAATQVMNMLLGAGMTSKLFMNVREKLSLCYSIGSGYYSAKGIVTVSAGVDFDKEEAARQEILRQLDAVCRGDFTAAEVEAARQALLSGLRGVEDSPSGIEGYYATAAMGGVDRTAASHMAAVEAVTPAQIAQAAQQLQLHTTYFLRGADHE